MPEANVRRDHTGNPDPPRRWHYLGGVAFIPRVPGLAPGAFMNLGGIWIDSSPLAIVVAGLRRDDSLPHWSEN